MTDDEVLAEKSWERRCVELEERIEKLEAFHKYFWEEYRCIIKGCNKPTILALNMCGEHIHK